MIEMMVREENHKTIYTKFDDSKRLWIIPDSEFRKDCDETSPIFTGSHSMQFEHTFNFIEVMDDSKILCIGFNSRVDLYNIKEEPLCPKLIKSLLISESPTIILLKLDENLLLL